MYTPLNQYHVVMVVAPEFWQNPLFLRQTYVQSPAGRRFLLALSPICAHHAPLSVNHQGLPLGDHLLQPQAGHRAGRRRGRIRKRPQDRVARHHSYGHFPERRKRIRIRSGASRI